jgi:hypothetical protein
MLSAVELNERVRSLRPSQRLGYTLAVSVGIVAAFWFSILAGVILAALLVMVFIGAPLTVPDDLIVLGFPIFIIFMLIVGISGTGLQHRILSGQDVQISIRKAARSGFIVGLISGAVFGLGWAFLVGANPLLFAIVMGPSLAFPLAFFRAIAVIIEPISLRFFSQLA